jgi:excisionase family DNA binding protein
MAETPTPVDPDLVAYRVPQVAEMLKLSQRTVWSLIQKGDIETVRLGRSVLVPARSLRKLLNADAA